MPRISQYPKYETDQIVYLIKQHIHDKTDRRILYLRLVDGDTIAEIAAKVERDEKTVSEHLKKGEKELFSHLPAE